jgi:hypothetical protein
LRPLEGTVISTGAELVIRLMSGATIDVPHRPDLLPGDACYILFDYTRLCIYAVWSEDEYNDLGDWAGPEDRSEQPPSWEKQQRWLDESMAGPVVSL